MISHSNCRGDECHWADWGIPDPIFQPFYEVSCTGRVWSVRSQRDMAPATQWNGYRGVVFSANKKLKRYTVHQLVASAFCRRPDGATTVDHLDGDKTNNHAANLEWVTLSENHRRAIALGLAAPPPRRDVRGGMNSAAKLTEAQVRWILSHEKKYGVGTRLAAQLGVTASLVQAILRGERWNHLSRE